MSRDRWAVATKVFDTTDTGGHAPGGLDQHLIDVYRQPAVVDVVEWAEETPEDEPLVTPVYDLVDLVDNSSLYFHVADFTIPFMEDAQQLRDFKYLLVAHEGWKEHAETIQDVLTVEVVVDPTLDTNETFVLTTSIVEASEEELPEGEVVELEVDPVSEKTPEPELVEVTSKEVEVALEEAAQIIVESVPEEAKAEFTERVKELIEPEPVVEVDPFAILVEDNKAVEEKLQKKKAQIVEKEEILAKAKKPRKPAA